MKEQIINLTFDKQYKSNYIIGYDPCKGDSASFYTYVKNKPRKVYGIKKIRGFKRVVEKGWEYVVELVK